VLPFRLDRDPVTRREYLEFVRAHPQWRRGAVARALPATSYLEDWSGVLNAGGAAELARPVTIVTWRAARAYCVARGRRLPTTLEWEYVAAASADRRDASTDPAFLQHVGSLYATRGRNPLALAGAEVNYFGVRAMHDRVWEWVSDPNPAITTAHHHALGDAPHDVNCAGGALGGTDPRNYPAFLRAALRSALEESTTLATLGFRCAA
jgi:formylglycine-generating enzyme required for sulfatase activity